MLNEKQNYIRKDDRNMNPDEKFEALPIIDKTEFTDDEFPDEINNKKSVIKVDEDGKIHE